MECHYLETMLQGGRVLTVNIASLEYVDLQSRRGNGDATQMWRIKVCFHLPFSSRMTSHLMSSIQENGCLENQAKPGCCLEVDRKSSGSPVYMRTANGQANQRWTPEITLGVGYLRSELTVGFVTHLSLDIARADVPLIIDHVGPDVKVRDFTQSQTWRFTKK